MLQQALHGLLQRQQRLLLRCSSLLIAAPLGADHHGPPAAQPWSFQQQAGLRSTIMHQGRSKRKAGPATPDGQPAAAGDEAAQAPSTPQSAPSGARAAAPPRSANSLVHVDVRSPSLSTEHLGSYYPLQSSLLPEAWPALHQTFYAPRGPNERPRSGGCKGLQQEAKVASAAQPGSGGSPGAGGTVSLMHRAAGAAVWAALTAPRPGQDGARVLLRGPAGAGKSCVLAALVERARASGWLAVYVPSATALVKGGVFEPRELGPGGARRVWDTPIAAQHILLGTQQAHGKQLAQLPCRLDVSAQLARAAGTKASASSSAASAGGKEPGQGPAAPEGAVTLAQLVTAGLAAEDAHTPVLAAQALLSELGALASPSQPVLLAVDDYNALYGATEYARHVKPLEEDEEEDDDEEERERQRAHEADAAPEDVAHLGPPGSVRRVPLRVDQLALASSLRALEQPPGALGGAHVVAATSDSIGVALRTRVPVEQDVREFHVPRFSKVELAHMLQHYWEREYAPEAPTSDALHRLLLLTNGNAAEVRQLVPTMSLRRARATMASNVYAL